MRRVIRFTETNKTACEKLNDWLAEHPQVVLVDIKPDYGFCKECFRNLCGIICGSNGSGQTHE